MKKLLFFLQRIQEALGETTYHITYVASPVCNIYRLGREFIKDEPRGMEIEDMYAKHEEDEELITDVIALEPGDIIIMDTGLDGKYCLWATSVFNEFEYSNPEMEDKDGFIANIHMEIVDPTRINPRAWYAECEI